MGEAAPPSTAWGPLSVLEASVPTVLTHIGQMKLSMVGEEENGLGETTLSRP